MPQLESFFFFGESVTVLLALYSFIYFYLFWFSKQNFEYWLINSRFTYYFELSVVFVFYNIFYVLESSNAGIMQSIYSILSINALTQFLNAME